MNYKNLNKKYTIKIIAVKNNDPYKGYELFECPVETFGQTAMRVIKDGVAEKLVLLDKKVDKEA